MGNTIPEIGTISKSKRKAYAEFKAKIPKNVEIKFNNPNQNETLDPTEWIEYEQDGQRIVGYSPFGNKKNTDTPATIAKRLGVTEDVIANQTGKKINPNSFLRLVLPKSPKIKAPGTDTSQKSNITQPQAQSVGEPPFKDAKKIGQFVTAEYSVKKGDSFAKLANQLNTTVDELTNLNNIDINKPLQIGQKLKYYSNRERYAFNSDISDELYLKALKTKLKGEFVGKENVILQAAKKHNIPVSTIYSIMMQETGWGTSNYVKNRHNPGGIKELGNLTTHRTFKTLDDGINEMARILAKYHKQGLDTLPEIQRKYSEDNQNWVPNTQKFQRDFCDLL